MRRFIHKLRQKSKSTRQKIALGTSASVTGLIFVIWLTVVVQGGVVTTTDSPQEAQTASPISALQSNANAAVDSLRDRLEAGPGTSSVAGVNAANGVATTSSQPTTTQDSSTDTTAGSSQRVQQKPYWQANDDNKEDAEDQLQAKPGADFWHDDQEEQSGWLF